MPAWITLLLAFWLGSATGFVLAIVVMSRLNAVLRKQESDHET